MTGRCWVVKETFSSQVTTIMGENLCNREGKLLVGRRTYHLSYIIISKIHVKQIHKNGR